MVTSDDFQEISSVNGKQERLDFLANINTLLFHTMLHLENNNNNNNNQNKKQKLIYCGEIFVAKHQ